MTQRIAGIIRAYSEQGDHRTGTNIDALSARWLASEIESLAVTPELDTFEFSRLDSSEATLCAENLELHGVPLYDCGYTTADGIKARLGDPGETGTIAMISVPALDGGDRLRLLEALRSQSTHPALIVMIESQGSATGPAVLNAESYRSPFGVPVLQLAYQHAPTLQQIAQRRGEVCLVASCQRTVSEAINVQARIEGQDSNAAPLVVMTPRSGWWRCASERGGGIAAFLEIMRALRDSPPARPVIFTANTGHELSHLGLDQFLHKHPELIDQAFAWIHLGANFAAANAPVRLQFSDSELQAISQRELDACGLAADQITPLEQRPFGEARNIFDGGGRYVSILGGNPLFHHPDDVWPEAIDLAKTTAWSEAITAIALELSR